VNNLKQDTEVVKFFQKDKEIKDLKLAIGEIVKRQDQIEEALQNMINSFNQSSPQVIPYTQPVAAPASNPFSQIKEFAQAMKSLKTYEHSILDSYRQIRRDNQKEMSLNIAPDPDEDTEILKMVLQAVGQKNQQSAPQNVTPEVPNYTALDQLEVPKQESEIMQFDYESIKKSIPEYIKRQIKDGSLSLEDTKNMVMPEIKKRGLPVTEQNIEKLYSSVLKSTPSELKNAGNRVKKSAGADKAPHSKPKKYKK